MYKYVGENGHKDIIKIYTKILIMIMDTFFGNSSFEISLTNYKIHYLGYTIQWF